MAFTRRDFMKAANAIRTKEKVLLGGKEHRLDARDRYVAALIFRDLFQAEDPLFNGLAFLTECGLKG
jgi:hypothetical protein